MNCFIESITLEESNDLGSPVKSTQTLKHANPSNENEIHSRMKVSDEGKNLNFNKANEKGDFSKIYEIFNNNLPSEVNSLKKEQKYDVIKKSIDEYFVNEPESLRIITAGFLFSEDIGRLPDQVPEWLDREKFARGQKFARDNLFGIFFAEYLALFLLFSFDDGLKPMILTQKSSEPYTAFKRYLSTSTRIRNWYNSDPWTKGSPAYKDLVAVNHLHQAIRNKLNSMTYEEIENAGTLPKTWSPIKDTLLKDFNETCPVALPGQCPYTISELRGIRPKGLNQGDMSATQCAFVCLMILYPDKFGVHDHVDEDLDAFCHLWRGIGYLLGINDEFNFCRGSLEDIKMRSKDFIDYWVKPNFRNISPEWEHMMRCMHEGNQYYFPGSSYEVDLLFLTDLLELNMPRLQSLLTTSDWIMYYVTKFMMRHLVRIPQIKSFLVRRLNEALDRALKYDEEKHETLRKKSSEVLNKVLNQTPMKNKQSFINLDISLQYKYIGLIVPFLLFFISWKINSMLM
ncbi:uncharacterized protein [Chelonus insularis]|uniref:uncharacterized protein n=1 Tax=Chelonus insularis TaxID=460826 RepID=UPI00158A4B42|nr:uncharacterized protein LOC118066119 [Chelonus insularis]XP_034937806.1 uncharacterized protein LOC118066119 [Chelonus insularis]XP_034937808.1 uncharacterized protein LOC118066119 [Chelonus insularis]XP_034937809.1 uncharacterized protein LOC118066119 [Chelonus insularis]XP_034937810.1 uncharacterized protein LOC118066119 [Chelonus insularis]